MPHRLDGIVIDRAVLHIGIAAACGEEPQEV
jgi:hypothetical protein